MIQNQKKCSMGSLSLLTSNGLFNTGALVSGFALKSQLLAEVVFWQRGFFSSQAEILRTAWFGLSANPLACGGPFPSILGIGLLSLCRAHTFPPTP